MSENQTVRSVLVGNGLDIQAGGDDYLNKWIIVRLLAKAKMGKYDGLFMNSQNETPLITGDEIITLFSGMVGIANDARTDKYANLIDPAKDNEVIEALKDFQTRYQWTITSPEEIGIEDWLLMLRLFFTEHRDIADQYESAKQGFARMVLDSIYCEGNIQNLFSKTGKNIKAFFNGFDNVFTLNYDNSLEKITDKPVFHLHGDFGTKAFSENPNTAYGRYTKERSIDVWFPPHLKHCNCSAILDFSGSNKYRLAVNLSKLDNVFQELQLLSDTNRAGFNSLISQFPLDIQELAKDIITVGIDKSIPFGYDYYFNNLEQLTGELTIIGLAPRNDSHIFECINKSSVEKVVFYNFFPQKVVYTAENGECDVVTLPINKPYEIKDVAELWSNVKLNKPINVNNNLQIVSNKNSVDLLKVVNAFCGTEVTLPEVLQQLKTIPPVTRRIIIEMMVYEINKVEYRTTPQSKEELYNHFRNFGKTLVTSSLSPQALYILHLTNSYSSKSKNQKHTYKKRKKR